MNITTLKGNLDGKGMKVALLASRFNGFVVDALVTGAQRALLEHGVAEDDITFMSVPGALELSVVAETVAAKGGVDAIVAVGAIIRGETYHFEIVANESARGVADVATRHQLPVLNGVITTNDEAQAMARAGSVKSGSGEHNKGAEAAIGAIEMVNLLRQL